jgi:tetratricopeptide (TPR) repeat protein
MHDTAVRGVLFGLGLALAVSGCHERSAAPPAVAPESAALAAVRADAAVAQRTIEFLEHRVRDDPLDIIALDKLAGQYLQRVRETGDVTYLRLATRAAEMSLAAVPAEENVAGLAALAQAEHASHRFAEARDHARQLVALDGGQAYPYQLLGDAFLELGAYDEAGEAYRQMRRRRPTGVATESRRARMALLHGAPRRAAVHLEAALANALAAPAPSRESVAWCRWQRGEVAFMIGDYAEAERWQRQALAGYPDYPHALASLARARAALGDRDGAIELYERAVSILPDPSVVAALGDLYAVAGRDSEARTEYALVEAIARLNAAQGALYDRQIAMFHADHDTELAEGHASAISAFAVRRDVYGADAVAWTAYKVGSIDEARAAIQEALRLGTRDTRLFFHAGMIARAAGDTAMARAYLARALRVSPNFDPLQGDVARAALAGLAS